MRKRLVIGAIAAVMIGIAAYVLSKPKKGTVQYHKGEFLKATRLGPVASYLDEMGVINDPKRNRREFHRQALLEAGYLTTATFVVTNRSLNDVWSEFRVALASVLGPDEYVFTQEWWTRTNAIIVVAPKTAMDQVGAFVRKLDVPETK